LFFVFFGNIDTRYSVIFKIAAHSVKLR